MKSCEDCDKKDCLNNGLIGYCLECPECGVNWKEEKMEFLKERCFTSLNADELRAGDKVIVANTMAELKRIITGEIYCIAHIMRVNDEDCENRFCIGESNATGDITYPLAYLVERAENCTNCGKTECAGHGEHEDFKVAVCSNWIPKAEPKTEKEDNMWNYESLPERQEMGVSDHVIVAVEGCPYGQSGYYDFDLQAWFVDGCSEPVKVEAWQKIELPKIEKAEKKYRPFKDTDELIKVWQRKCGNVAVRLHKLDAPYIWVRYKAHPENNYLITGLFWENDEVFIGQYSYKLSEFFRDWEFLDGTPCGVEE